MSPAGDFDICMVPWCLGFARAGTTREKMALCVCVGSFTSVSFCHVCVLLWEMKVSKRRGFSCVLISGYLKRNTCRVWYLNLNSQESKINFLILIYDVLVIYWAGGVCVCSWMYCFSLGIDLFLCKAVSCSGVGTWCLFTRATAVSPHSGGENCVEVAWSVWPLRGSEVTYRNCICSTWR